MNEFHPQESLQLIRAMIDRAKDNLSENRIYFLFWGWLSFVLILAQFVLKVVVRYPHHYLVWAATLPASVVTMWYAAKHRRRGGMRTYVGESMSHLWSGIGVSFFVLVIVVMQQPKGFATAWPLFILFYGLGTYVSGRILKFRPLVIGGILNWALAVAAAFTPFDYQLLLAAAAILTSYIIPGHLLATQKN